MDIHDSLMVAYTFYIGILYLQDPQGQNERKIKLLHNLLGYAINLRQIILFKFTVIKQL